MYWLDFLFNEHAVSYQKENIDLQTSLYKIYKTREEEQQCEKEGNEKKRDKKGRIFLFTNQIFLIVPFAIKLLLPRKFTSKIYIYILRTTYIAFEDVSI